jgi:hypothetical protein
VLTVVVLLQIALGFQLLNDAEAMVPSHEMNGFLIVVLALVTGGITSMGARRQKTQTA